YAEVIVRTLSYNTQDALSDSSYPYRMPRYLKNGRIDVTCLLEDFQTFWRENSESWFERYDYKEAAPHLILQAFLQRVVNGGGTITREMAAGRNRLDLCVEFERRKYPIELKLRRGDKTERDGLEQLAGYMDTLGCTEGWLIVFDRRADVKWDDKIYLRTETVDGKTIVVAGC
ncbi:MAG: ATP-binding protein, partial [Tannerella sp.]|nr:ATP-binding protein [Tannerella sp.]